MRETPDIDAREQAVQDVRAFGHAFLYYNGHNHVRLDPRCVIVYGGSPAGAVWSGRAIGPSPEALPGPRRGQRRRGGPAAALGAERPGEDHGEPPVMPWSGALPEGGAALLSAVANMMLDFDSQEGIEHNIGDSWKQKHRQRLIDALTGGEGPLSDDGAVRVEFGVAIACLFLLAFLAWRVATL